MPYHFEREYLVTLLKQAYEEGVHGYHDLAESVAEKLAEEAQEHFKGLDPYPRLMDQMPSVVQFEQTYTPSVIQFDPYMAENPFCPSRIHNYEVHTLDSCIVPPPEEHRGIMITASSGHRIMMTDEESLVKMPVLSSNEEQPPDGFHWETFDIAQKEESNGQVTRQGG